MHADAFAGFFAEAVAEEDEHYHEGKGEDFRKDACAEEDGVEDAMSQDRCAEDPESVDARSHRIKAHKRVVIAHQDAEEHVSGNREYCTGDAGRNPVLR